MNVPLSIKETCRGDNFILKQVKLFLGSDQNLSLNCAKMLNIGPKMTHYAKDWVKSEFKISPKLTR